jgi:hypothetical protein
MMNLNSMFYATGVQSTGVYAIPAAHVITLADAQTANVNCNYSLEGLPINNDFAKVPDVAQMTDFVGNDPSVATAQVQINVKNVSGVWSGWQNFVPGQYYGMGFNFQVVLGTANSQYTPTLTGMSFGVSVPDKVQSGTLTTATGGSSVTYSQTYNIVPNTVITITDEVNGDIVSLTNQTESGFTVQITNGGVGQARTITWHAVGY